MPSVPLSLKVLKELSCPACKSKVDFYDLRCKGLMLEIRASGGKTWYLRYRDTHGKQRQFRIADYQDLSLEQVRKRTMELRGQIAIGEDPREIKQVLRAMPTLKDFVYDRYLPFVKGYKRSWKTDESLLRNHIIPRLGKLHLDEIQRQDIIAMHHERLACGAAPGSANRLLIMTRYIFNLALRWDVPGITKNPSAGISLFEENNKKERYLSHEETPRLYKAVLHSENTMLQYIIPMLILTGARKRELLDAKWEDFDLPRQSWRIPMTKTGKPRRVPLSGGVLQLLASIPRHDCDWVFPNPKTLKPYVSIFYSWNTARKAAGLADVRIHDLRHSFASFLVNSGRTLYEVQKILGHTQVKTTQRYAHLSQETLIEAANSAVAVAGIGFASQTTIPA